MDDDEECIEDEAFPPIMRTRSYIKLDYNFRKQTCTVTVKSVELLPSADPNQVAHLFNEFNLDIGNFFSHPMDIDNQPRDMNSDPDRVDPSRFFVGMFVGF